MKYKITFLTGTIFNEETEYNLNDLCTLYNISTELIQDMINEGLIIPKGSSPPQWRFGYLEIRRIQTAMRLQHDLHVNLPGCALVLDLLEELEELRNLKKIQ
jgi:chaperone modulatory protein CbpM